jgi:hypothetical protein
MTPKSLVLMVSMLTFVAISGEAVAAGQTMHKRHAIAEEQRFNDVVQSENAYDALMPQAIAPIERHYEGGPKSDIY